MLVELHPSRRMGLWLCFQGPLTLPSLCVEVAGGTGWGHTNLQEPPLTTMALPPTALFLWFGCKTKNFEGKCDFKGKEEISKDLGE